MLRPKVETTKGHRSMSAASAMSDRTVYSISKIASENIVDLVLKIMDGDGPRPMKNLRPVQKNRTGADQFYLDHHGEYEARGQPSRDRINRVNTHNNACPKMYDELNKRRSTAQPELYLDHQKLAPATYFDPKCRDCVKLKSTDGRKNRARKRSRQSSNVSKPKSKSAKSKITKPKKPRRRYRSPVETFKLSRIRTNKGCQCTSYYLPAETRSVCTFKSFKENFVSMPGVPAQETQDIQPATVAPTCENNDVKSVKSPITKVSKNASRSDVDSRNPETNSAPSISSYNSFLSMEHEPMIE